jgi:hemolysin III
LKEPFSGLSHMLGAVLSVAAVATLLWAARGNALHLVSFALYGMTLVSLFIASGMVHSLHLTPRTVARLQRLDYIAIFLLIAGTCVPICLVALGGSWGWSLLVVEAAAALVGIAGVVFLRERFPEWLRVGLCAVMTWLILVAVVPLRQALSPVGLAWLLWGMVVYSVGTLILALDRPHLWPGRFSAHDLWHLFVLGGSACHLVVMFLIALGATPGGR